MKNSTKFLMMIGAIGFFYFNKGKIMSTVNSAVWKIDPRGNKFDIQFAAAEKKYNLPAGLMRRMAYQESRFNPNARSPVGAIGLMQFMPKTAAEFKINPLDPAASIDAAGKYMQQLRRMTTSWSEAVAAYNWGIGNVMRKGIAKAPPETIAYMKIASDVGVA